MSTGRNDPCPCGSGKRFKHCCGVLQNGPAAEPPPLTAAQLRADELFEGVLPLLQAGGSDEARGVCEEILRLDPDHPGALYSLGVMAYQAGSYARADELVRRAI